jgi:hypothetical protein
VVFPHQNQIKSKFGDYKTKKKTKTFLAILEREKKILLPTGRI